MKGFSAVCPDGFKYQIQSLRIVDFIENNGRGLNLTKEVKDGIENHQTSGSPSTLEGRLLDFR